MTARLNIGCLLEGLSGVDAVGWRIIILLSFCFGGFQDVKTEPVFTPLIVHHGT